MTDAKLKSYVERIERLEEERKAIGGDVRDIYTEAKGNRYNPKALRKIIAMRRQKADPVVDAEVEAYKAALGMAVDMVSNGDVSLRKAAKATGVSKSSIHRALAVPAVSHDPRTGEIPPEQERPEQQSPVGQAAPFEVSNSPGGPAAVDNPGGDHVAAPELIPIHETIVFDDAPAGALKAGSSSTGDSDDAGLMPKPEVARAAPPADAAPAKSLYQRITGAFHDPTRAPENIVGLDPKPMPKADTRTFDEIAGPLPARLRRVSA